MKAWLLGLAAAAIGGAAQGSLQMIASSGHIVGSQIGASAGITAALVGLAYLLKSPLTTQTTAAATPTPDVPAANAPVNK